MSTDQKEVKVWTVIERMNLLNLSGPSGLKTGHHVVLKSDFDAVVKERDEYKKHVFEYSHLNVRGEYAGHHIAEALVLDHKELKFAVRDKDAVVKERDELERVKQNLCDALNAECDSSRKKDAEIAKLREALSEDKLLEVIEEWQMVWRNQNINPEDTRRYRRRALSVDANMRGSLARMISEKALNKGGG